MELAQLKVPGISGTLDAPSGIPNPSTTSAGNVLSFVLALLLAVAVVGAVGLLMWGAIGWITSQGDKQKVQKARSTIVAAIIGLIIVLFAFIVISVLGKTLGISGWVNLVK
jgi:nitrate reductase NapE component